MRKIYAIFFALIFVCQPVLAQAPKVRYLAAIPERPIKIINKVVEKVKEYCQVPVVDNPVYAGQLVSVSVPDQVDSNHLFDVTIRYLNTGNEPWFSNNSGCPGQSWTFLGTTRQQDRESAIFAPGVFGDTKWYQSNRINLKQPRVNPGEIAEFTFVGHSPLQDGIYREYFAPVIEGKGWLKDTEATFDLKVGHPNEDENILRFTRELDSSINLLDPLFYGEKRIIIKLSTQTMQIKVGDLVIKNFQVSSGKPKTPTPPGNYKILLKQDVRVAGEYPHYIMPRFMMLRKGGYGIHSLPSLANDHGVFWTEALNHIGQARSHGCVRLLPDASEFAYNFADVGTPVDVIW